jgi:hypothetical protein
VLKDHKEIKGHREFPEQMAHLEQMVHRDQQVMTEHPEQMLYGTLLVRMVVAIVMLSVMLLPTVAKLGIALMLMAAIQVIHPLKEHSGLR